MNPSRKPLIAGNWKMFHGDRSGAALAADCVKVARTSPGVEFVIAPPYTALASCAAECRDSPMTLAAQNLYVETDGSCTGEISAQTIRDIGCTWVLIGHSERRRLFAEGDELVAVKVEAALRVGLRPIVCVGDTLAQRDAGHALRVIRRQVDAVSPILVNAGVALAIAYEPVWAIGTGKTDTPKDVEEVHAAIRGWLLARDATLAEKARLLYGGSVKPENATSLLACPNVDGALVGGASLDVESFAAIARAAVRQTTSPGHLLA